MTPYGSHTLHFAKMAETQWVFVSVRSIGMLLYHLGLHYCFRLGVYRPTIRCLEIASEVSREPLLLASLFFNVANAISDTHASYGMLREARVHTFSLKTALEKLNRSYALAHNNPRTASRSEEHQLHLFGCKTRVVARLIQIHNTSPRNSSSSVRSAASITATITTTPTVNLEERSWVESMQSCVDYLLQYEKLSESPDSEESQIWL